MSNKSFFAKIEEKILMFTKPEYMDSKDKIDEFIREKSLSQDKIPKGIFKSRDFNGMEIFMMKMPPTLFYTYMVELTSTKLIINIYYIALSYHEN